MCIRDRFINDQGQFSLDLHVQTAFRPLNADSKYACASASSCEGNRAPDGPKTKYPDPMQLASDCYFCGKSRRQHEAIDLCVSCAQPCCSIHSIGEGENFHCGPCFVKSFNAKEINEISSKQHSSYCHTCDLNLSLIHISEPTRPY